MATTKCMRLFSDNVLSQFIVEEVLMDSYGSRGRLPLASELVRRLKPAVVPDPLFGQTTFSETLIFKYEVIFFSLLCFMIRSFGLLLHLVEPVTKV